MGHCREWDTLLVELAGHFDVISLDQRGHGRSDHASPETYTVSAMADDLVALLAHLGLARVHLVGHSMGAMVAMAAAASRLGAARPG